MDEPPIFNTPEPPWVNEPAPAKAVETVKMPLFVYDPENVADGITISLAPLIVLDAPVKVCTPEPVNEPSFCRLPAKATAAAAVSFQTPFGFTVTFPVNVLVPVAEFMAKVPLVPPPTVVVPPMVNANPAAVRAVPSPIFKFPVTVNAATVVAEAVPLRERLPATAIPLLNVFVPEPERIRLL